MSKLWVNTLCILLCIALTLHGEIIPGFCNVNNNSATTLVKGSPTYICININDKYRAVFSPTVDQYVQLRLHDCKDLTVTTVHDILRWIAFIDTRIGFSNISGTFLTISSMKSRSVYKQYTNPPPFGKAYPILTAVISVKMGEVNYNLINTKIKIIFCLFRFKASRGMTDASYVTLMRANLIYILHQSHKRSFSTQHLVMGIPVTRTTPCVIPLRMSVI
jgi:hypothetical protein